MFVLEMNPLALEVLVITKRALARRKFETLAHGEAFLKACLARGWKAVAIRLNDPLPPPKGWKPEGRGHYWCGFCVKARKFVHDQRLGLTKCPVCGMSTRNWYVRQHNNLWGDA